MYNKNGSSALKREKNPTKIIKKGEKSKTTKIKKDLKDKNNK